MPRLIGAWAANASTTLPSRMSGSQQHSRPWYAALLSPLWLYLLMALLVRLWLVLHTNGVIDGDESLVGIQAEHILHGELPLYFYGQAYMGSLEAYLIAILFAIAGPSVLVLRCVPMLLSLVVVWLTWKLAATLAEMAQFPPDAKTIFMNIATLFAALAPLYDAVLELRTLGGYIEAFVIMLLLLLWTLQLLQSWHAGAPFVELVWRWAGIGFISGLGLWVNPLFVSAALAAGIWIVSYCIRELVSLLLQRQSKAQRTITSFLKSSLAALALIPAAVIGSAPALYWGATNHWENVTYLLNRSTGSTFGTESKLARNYLLCILPRVIGGALPTENGTPVLLHALPLALGVFCTLAVIVLVPVSLFRKAPFLLRVQRLAALPLLFAISTAFFFCISSGPTDCSSDALGRYATPLVLVLPIFLASIFTLVSMRLAEMPGREARFQLPRMLQGGLYALLFAALGLQLCAYALADPGYTFQSPSCTYAPARDEPIIAYLQQQHIRYAWAISWIGFPIDFKTNGNMIVADPRPLMSQPPTMGRVPAYIEAVRSADRPAMLVFVHHGDPYPELLKILDAGGVTYHMALFPSEPGYDILVVTPLNRTVSPLESMDFQNVFTFCKQ